MMLNINDKAARSVDFCPAAALLPPYPALGLAWMAMANNSASIDIATSKALHALVNSITLVNVNKAAKKDPYWYLLCQEYDLPNKYPLGLAVNNRQSCCPRYRLKIIPTEKP